MSHSYEDICEKPFRKISEHTVDYPDYLYATTVPSGHVGSMKRQPPQK